MLDDFAIFICTHGRPQAQYTLQALNAHGYTHRVILLLDDEDPTYDEYVNTYPNIEIYCFCKQTFIDNADTCEQIKPRKCILYAKNAADDIAHDMKLSAYVVADDDILRFRHRIYKDSKLCSYPVTNMNEVIQSYVTFMHNHNIAALSFGDIRLYMDGRLKIGRIPYNFVFRNVCVSYEWHSAMYEDTITPVLENIRGAFTLELPDIQFDMKPSDNNASGGMTDVYDNISVFRRAGTTLLYHPSCVEYANNLVGFKLIKDRAFPKLISGGYKNAII